MSDERDRRIHHNTNDTRERAYDRLRQTGVGREAAREIAERATREAHDKLNRR
jgi:hypothetical protein